MLAVVGAIVTFTPSGVVRAAVGGDSGCRDRQTGECGRRTEEPAAGKPAISGYLALEADVVGEAVAHHAVAVAEKQVGHGVFVQAVPGGLPQVLLDDRVQGIEVVVTLPSVGDSGASDAFNLVGLEFGHGFFIHRGEPGPRVPTTRAFPATVTPQGAGIPRTLCYLAYGNKGLASCLEAEG